MYKSRKRRTKFIRGIIAPFAVVALLAACGDDDPTGPDDGDMHIEAFGFMIESEGVEMLRYMDDSGETPVLPALQAGTSTEMVVVFLDEDGNPLEHEEHAGEEHEEDELRVTIANGAIAAWTPEEHMEGEEHEHVEFHGELEALAAGSTGMQVCILHEDHCDYESPTITVQVNAP